MYQGFSFLTSLKSLVNALMISAFCRLLNISLLTTPKQKNHSRKWQVIKNPYNSISRGTINSLEDFKQIWCVIQNIDMLLFPYWGINVWLLIIAWAKIREIIFDPCPYSGGRSWSLTFTSTGLNNEVDEDQKTVFLVLFVAVEPLIHHRLLDREQPVRMVGFDRADLQQHRLAV